MRALKLLCLTLLSASCVDAEDTLELSTEDSALTNQFNVCTATGQIDQAEVSRMYRSVRVLPPWILPIDTQVIKAGRAFLIRGSGYVTLPAGTVIEAVSMTANLQVQTQTWRELGVTSNGELLVIPPAPLPNAVFAMLTLKFEKRCGPNVVASGAWGMGFRSFDPVPLSTQPLGNIASLTATPLSATTARLKWKDAGLGGESGFLVWFRTRGAQTFQLAGAVGMDDTEEDLGPLPSGTELEFQVAAYDGMGIGSRSAIATAKMPAGPGQGGGVVMPPVDPEARSFVDLSEAQFAFNQPPLDCQRNVNPIKCRFQVTAVTAVFDRNRDGVIGPASAGTNSKMWPLEQFPNAAATITGTETIQGARYAPGANLVVLAMIEPVTGGGGRGIGQQFVAFHVEVTGAGFRVVDVRGGDFMLGVDALVMKMDMVRSSRAGFTLPSGNTFGRITGGSQLVAHLAGSDTRSVLNNPGITSTYGVTAALTIAPQGVQITFDE